MFLTFNQIKKFPQIKNKKIRKKEGKKEEIKDEKRTKEEKSKRKIEEQRKEKKRKKIYIYNFFRVCYAHKENYMKLSKLCIYSKLSI